MFRSRSRSPLNRNKSNNSSNNSIINNEQINTNKMAITNLELSMAKDMLPEYSGGSKNLAYFISQAEQFITLLKRPEDCLFNKLLFEQVKAKIVGEARDVLISNKITSWSEIKDVLLNKFGDPRSEELLANDLVTCYQETNETYESYYERIKYKLQTLLEHISIRELNQDIKISKTNMYTNNALTTFKAGILEPYCSHLIHLHISTLEQALFECRKYDNDRSQISFINFIRNKGKISQTRPQNNSQNSNFRNKHPQNPRTYPQPSYVPHNLSNKPIYPNKFPTGPINIQTRPVPQQNLPTNAQVFGKKPEPKPTPMSVCTTLKPQTMNKSQNFKRNFPISNPGPRQSNFTFEELYNTEIESGQNNTENYVDNWPENFPIDASETEQQ